MKWGVYLTTAQHPEQTTRQVLENTINYTLEAEKMGFDDVWVLEHHFTKYGIVSSPTIMAAHLLAKTENIKVGTAISTITLDHPVRLAEEVAHLDQLSNGRFLFGIGRGSFVKDFKVFGVDMSKSREIMDEWTRIMVGAWTKGKVSSNSERLCFDEVEIYPEIYTKPHPPIYVVAQAPSTTEWAAKQGFPLILNFTLEDDAKASQIQLYNEVASEAGHDPSKIDHILSCLAGVGDTDWMYANSKEYFSWWLEEGVRAIELFDRKNDKQDGYEWHQRQWKEWVIKGKASTESRYDRYMRLNPIGSPELCVEKLQKTIDATGIRHVICGFESLGSPEQILESMCRFKNEVIPNINTPQANSMLSLGITV
jgi:alkanal monooxygenase alpha chain